MTTPDPLADPGKAMENLEMTSRPAKIISTDPYLIEGPALISFSGGRTSAFMLYQILQAHGGALPDNVVVAFANTGKEREETLRFVHECGSRWGVKVHWLEWRRGDKFEEVGFNSASRNGEPFAALIDAKHAVPNSFMRFCTEDLKVTTMRGFVRSLGWTHCLNPVGLRADEGKRVAVERLAHAAVVFDIDVAPARKQPHLRGKPDEGGRFSGALPAFHSRFYRNHRRDFHSRRKPRPGSRQCVTGDGRTADRAQRQAIQPGLSTQFQTPASADLATQTRFTGYNSLPLQILPTAPTGGPTMGALRSKVQDPLGLSRLLALRVQEHLLTTARIRK